MLINYWKLYPLKITDLNQLIEANSPKLEIYRRRIEQRKYNLKKVISSWYPKVDLNSGFWPIVSWPTEPFLKQTRKLISPMGGVDITPIVWVGLISLSRELLVGPQGLLTQVIFKISLLS